MAQNLKCIGGLCDGQFVTIHDGQKHFMVRERMRLSGAFFHPGRASEIREIPYREHCYVIGHMCGSNANAIAFLHPVDWTMGQVLQQVFGVPAAETTARRTV